jgi:hypothetical protein
MAWVEIRSCRSAAVSQASDAAERLREEWGGTIMTYFKAFVPTKYDVHVHFIRPGVGITQLRQMRNEHETHQQISMVFWLNLNVSIWLKIWKILSLSDYFPFYWKMAYIKYAVCICFVVSPSFLELADWFIRNLESTCTTGHRSNVVLFLFLIITGNNMADTRPCALFNSAA